MELCCRIVLRCTTNAELLHHIYQMPCCIFTKLLTANFGGHSYVVPLSVVLCTFAYILRGSAVKEGRAEQAKAEVEAETMIITIILFCWSAWAICCLSFYNIAKPFLLRNNVCTQGVCLFSCLSPRSCSLGVNMGQTCWGGLFSGDLCFVQAAAHL